MGTMAGDPLIGQQLDEYRLETLLGRGGMARVYRGLDMRLGRYAAIKVIDTPLRTTPEYATRFEREAQAIAKLEHPHIVRLYRYGEAQGLLYLAMHYIEGSDLGFVLQTYRDDGEFIEPEEARRMIREVCLALDYAHSKGIIHRDVKPSNILLDKQGQVYLTDFGLALLTEFGTRGEVFGSPHYIAPEQAISSAKVVPQSDLYSVGIILYEMFTDQTPFDAETPLDIAMMHLSDPPPPPRELRPDISPQLENVILKTLAKEPGERYSTGAALADALDQALTRPVTKARPRSATTLPHRSIPERVALDPLAHPLPPLPAEVATPRGAPTLPRPVVAPPPRVPVHAVRKNTRAPIYIGTVAVLGLILLAAVLFLLSAGDDNGEDTSTLPTGTDEAALAVALTETASTAVALTETSTLPATAIPTERFTHTPTFTPTATLTPTFTSTPTSTLTFTPTPTLTPAPTATTAGAGGYEILVAKRGEDSLLVVNQGDGAFPLAPLRLGEGEGTISGTEWGVDALEPGQCVAAWKDGGNPELPDVECELLGADLTRDGPRRFWKSTFKVFYGQRAEFVCNSERCLMTIPG
jgi:serine/threonine protein kinase